MLLDIDALPIEILRKALQSVSRQAMHDIQTPLAVIRMNAKQMVSFFSQEASLKGDDVELRNCLLQSAEHMLQASQYLNGVMNLFSACFQEISPINEREHFSLKHCIESAMREYPHKKREIKEAVGWEFRGADDLFLCGSHRYFVELFQYLSRNALRQCMQEHSACPPKIVATLEKAQGLINLEGPFSFPSNKGSFTENEECEAALEWHYINNIVEAHGGKWLSTATSYQIWLPQNVVVSGP